MPIARYKQLVDQLASEIREGRLAPGTRLPTHRQLASREGLALVTATRVYAELQAMGLVSGETGRGTFVRETALPRGLGIDQHAAAVGMLDLNFNAPALPGQAELLRSALRQLAASGDLEALLRYQPHGGRAHERAAIALYLENRRLTVPAEQVLIVDGAQHGLASTAMALLQPGDVVAVDALSYPGFKVLAQQLRLELIAIPAAGSGPDLDALELLCQRRKVRAVYAMPTLHNPLGWVMSINRRHAFAALIRRHGLLLIEDAAYAFLARDAPPPMAALLPESTVYVSGFSKSVATGLRVGFVAAPAVWISRIERAIRATTWNTPGVMTAMVVNWLRDGTVARLEAQKREDAQMRQKQVTQVFKGLPCMCHPSSYFVWLPMPDELRADQVAMALQTAGISVSTAEPFATGVQVPQALRLALGSVSLEKLRHALMRVRLVLDGATLR
ncbi:PLP-dependent aminotransferase family protein [Comamonas thiooxydans]|uniref:PLP-dependent aminotransferase family protein n=1 Tax=Comamonas thiooxydans TaxID=363952 RepID=A0AA42Q072_9BURK|nr:PLP-dependent aminotransferase family protein [Comamonas thiooxydans]MDH1334805.1 PLP-dependent aminotransferase family protein [Comamonas thiooxydans]MDH1741113.1 PLP-dependent aminotransferase family protein [Comamonas thiooxydans]MDH1787151.1 PLP-dependent aminotransferase family protein [Comamonas thiooxydans]